MRGGGEARVAASAASALRRDPRLAVFGEIEERLAGFVVDDRRCRPAPARSGSRRRDRCGCCLRRAARAAAVYSGLKRKCSSVLRWMVATMMMSPPRPPSPPLGPPRGTYFSRRNARQPLPPSPALTVILTSSTNIMKRPLRPDAAEIVRLIHLREAVTRRLRDALMLTNLPMRPRSRNSTMPVILANSVSSLPQPDVLAGLDRGAALPNDDRAAGNQLAAEDLHAQPLRVGIAPVFGTA